MVMDLAKTLEGLSAAATQGEWKHTFHAEQPSFGEITIPTKTGYLETILEVCGSNNALWRDAPDDGESEFKANGDFVAALVNAYRTGQLIVAQAGDVEAVAMAMHHSATWDRWEDAHENEKQHYRQLAQSAMPSLAAKDVEIARLREALSNVTKPIGYLQRRAEAEGSRLNGMAYQIANDIAFVQSIARQALGDEA